jgi:hypothetical protein
MTISGNRAHAPEFEIAEEGHDVLVGRYNR